MLFFNTDILLLSFSHNNMRFQQKNVRFFDSKMSAVGTDDTAVRNKIFQII